VSAPLAGRLLLALAADAARAATALARLTAPAEARHVTFTPGDIRVVTRTDGRWGASLRYTIPGLGSWGGDDGCESQIDALVSLVERTAGEIERRGGSYSDVLERAEDDAEAVALYRALVAEGLRALGGTLQRLDAESECPLPAETVDELLGATALAPAGSAP
jgi:hypothetical protein